MLDLDLCGLFLVMEIKAAFFARCKTSDDLLHIAKLDKRPTTAPGSI
jgi:hypothetical protein